MIVQTKTPTETTNESASSSTSVNNPDVSSSPGCTVLIQGTLAAIIRTKQPYARMIATLILNASVVVLAVNTDRSQLMRTAASVSDTTNVQTVDQNSRANEGPPSGPEGDGEWFGQAEGLVQR